MKFASQFRKTAILMAPGLGPWLNNSATIIHGIDPEKYKFDVNQVLCFIVDTEI